MRDFKLNSFLDYEKAVKYFADNKIDNVLSNSGNEHAVVIFDNMFRTAEREICLYARDIFSEQNEVTISPSYMKSLRKFLNKEGTRLRIVLKNYDENTSRNSLRDMVKQYPSKVELRKNERGEVKIGNTSVHFCIADGRMYRVEYDTDNRQAKCNFNDENAVNRYQTVFNQLFEASNRVGL